MSAYIPQPGDAVEAWLTDWICELNDNVAQANAVRAMREDYRAHGRHGTPLGQDIPAPPPDAAREALAARVQPVADAQQDRADRDGDR